jgi:hypothetical protein
MLHPHGIIALDLALEHARDLQREAAHSRLVAEARAAAAAAPGSGPGPARPWHPRFIAARLVRWLSDATQAISDAACSVATRLEGRSA